MYNLSADHVRGANVMQDTAKSPSCEARALYSLGVRVVGLGLGLHPITLAHRQAVHLVCASLGPSEAESQFVCFFLVNLWRRDPRSSWSGSAI